jgi:hypothetical protein
MRRLWVLLSAILVLVMIALFSTAGLPTQAQGQPFATNTPRVLPTNTPRPPVPTPVLPDAALDFYALRLWDEGAFVRLLMSQISGLTPGDDESALASRLTQHEMGWRFPNAPNAADQREALLATMLAAPPGIVDLRALAYTHLESDFNRLQPLLGQAGQIEANGWLYDIIPANIDNRGTGDAIVRMLYPAEAVRGGSIVYMAYVMVGEESAGSYRVFPADYPALPMNDTLLLELLRSEDVNGDGTTDLALGIVPRAGVSGEIRLFGWRGDRVDNLIAPDQRMFYNQQVFFPPTVIETVIYRPQSLRWGCLSQRTIRWTWTANFFRPQPDSGYSTQATIGCTLAAEEPLFAQPLPDAINRVENLVITLSGEGVSDPSLERARLGLAVLYALDGQIEPARQVATTVTDNMLDRQLLALLDSLEDGDMPVQICAAVVRAAPTPAYGLCDLDGLLTRLFGDAPLSRETPIREQLAALGIRVREQVTLRSVGRLDREAFQLDLPGAPWWAFAPTQPDVYVAERIAPPPGYEATPPRTTRRLDVPPLAIEAFLRGEYPTALVTLDNAARTRADLTPTPAFLYLRALTQEIIGQRVAARAAYYALWSEFPTSVWGRLAAAHLERR